MNQVEVLPPPIKSEGDKKDYRLIKLGNGLKALLIQKKKSESSSDGEDPAAANMTVDVGSFDDPPHVMGLAHFLEHMLHMGSLKYPEESGYNDFLTAHGGKRNAMTSGEYTTYFFKVSEASFPEALDRFAKQIESPLLSKSSMQREREAVDSEYKMKQSNDIARIESIFKSLVVDSHPAGMFDCGNLKTLRDEISDDDLHEELLKLHAKYVANKMNVVVQSSRSLDELQELVVERFSSIKRGPEPEPSPDQVSSFNGDNYFKPEFFNNVFYLLPKLKNSLWVSWVLPSTQKLYKVAPVDYISHIVYNEGEGGISSYLRDKHWITALSMESEQLLTNSSFTFVTIYVRLTPSGTENIDGILQAIFSYLLMIKQTPLEDHRRLYNEQIEKRDNEFKFHNEDSAINNVFTIAYNMTVYDDADILRGKSYQIFNESAILDVIDRLNQPKFNVLILSDKHESYPLREKYFNAEYDKISFPESYRQMWDERAVNEEFFLEKPNQFKVKNFEIFVNEEESQKYPVKIFNDDFVEVWHRLDDKFNIPKTTLKVKLLSPIVQKSSENYLMLSIFEDLFDYFLETQTSDASNAGYLASSSIDQNGFTLTFEGYSEKIKKLIDIVTTLLNSFLEKVDDLMFETIKTNMKESTSQMLKSNPRLNGDLMSKILFDYFHSSLDLFHQIDKVTLEGVQKFKTKFLSRLKMQILAQGNITRDQTLEIVSLIRANFTCEQPLEEYERKRRCYQMPLGNNVFRVRSLMLNDENSAIKNLYQIGVDTLRTRCLARLVVMILNPKAYDYLRSKEQLAYGVACYFDEKSGIVSLSVIVLSQEDKHPYSTVCGKMDTFMNEVATQTIENLTDEEFEQFRQARLKQLTAADLDLDSEVSRNWLEITKQDYVFDKFELAAKVTKNLSKTDLQDFFKSFTQRDNMRRLSVQIIGNEKIDEQPAGDESLQIQLITEKLSDDENLITDIQEFQKPLFLYPVVNFQIQ